MVSNNLLRFAADNYGFDKRTCKFITYGLDENKQLYTVSINGKIFILRFLKTDINTINQTKAEMDWLLYLSNKNVNVPLPLMTQNRELVISIKEDGENYIISVFSMAKGQAYNINNPKLWNIHVFFNWGKVVGKMHCLTKDYIPANNLNRRDEFNIRNMISKKLDDFPLIYKIAENLLGELDYLPKDKDSYGLIHNDLHPGNFFIDGENIHLFDFDKCAYSWYACDIANALYLALWLGRKNDKGIDFTNDIIKYFLSGYLSENNINEFWLTKIHLFMKLCKIALFSWGCDCENPNNRSNDKYLQERMRNIQNDILFTGYSIDRSLFKELC